MKTGKSSSDAVKKAAISVCLFCATGWSAADPCMDNMDGGENIKFVDGKGLLSTSLSAEIKSEPGAHQSGESCHQQEEEEEEVLITESGRKDDGNLLLQGHLRAIFILRQVLRLSVEQCAGYLSRNGGSLNPDDWFSVCSSCYGVVKECFTLQRRVVQLERRLEGVKLHLVNLIYSTSGAEQEQGRVKRRSPWQDLTFDIRETVLKDLSNSQDTGGTTNPTIRISSRAIKKSSAGRRHDGTESHRHGRRRTKSCGKRGVGKKSGRNNEISPESNLIIPELLDSEEAIFEHNFEEEEEEDDDAEEPSWEMEGPPARRSENNDSGSDWKPSEDDDDEPDSEAEDDADSKSEETMDQEEETEMPPSTATTTTTSQSQPANNNNNNNNTGEPRSWLNSLHRCHSCPASYKDKKHLLVHLQLHEPTGHGEVVNCSKCGWLVLENRLKQHTTQFCRFKKKVPRRTGTTTKKLLRQSLDARMRWRKKHPLIPYYCDHCPLIFPHEFRLLRHCRDHHSDKDPLSCQYCDDSNNDFFVSQQLLRKHVEGVHASEESRQGQEEKDGAATDPSSLEPEEEEEDSKLHKTCPECSETFPSQMKLDWHIANRHLEALLACKSCSYKTDKYAKYAAHLQVHKRRELRRAKREESLIRRGKATESKNEGGPTKGIPFYCDHCQMIYTQREAIVKHVQGFHSSAELPSCQTCASKFVSKQLLTLHVEAVHPEQEIQGRADGNNGTTTGPPPPPPEDDSSEPKSCPHCPESSFPSQMKLDFHIAKRHRHALLTCLICGHKSREYSMFADHSRTHQDKDTREKTFSCHLCGLSLGHKSSLYHHMQSRHPEELGLPSEVICPICGVSVRTKSILRQHTKYVHEKKKEHFCEFCGKAFCAGTDLKKHLLLHTAPRELQYKKGPFPCQYCDSKFNVRQGLYYHLKREHSDKYGLRCEQCGKGYCSKGALNQHQRRECNSSNKGSSTRKK